MAHIQKNTRAATGHLFDHYGRNAEEEKYKYLYRQNDSIDPGRTHLNYNLAPSEGKTQQEIFDERISQVKCLKRKDVNVMCSWVVTVPKDLDPKRTKEFMQHTYNFLENRYGRKNVISAYVHMDETTPHMHFAFIPIVFDEKKQIEKVCAKEIIDRHELQVFHEELQDYLENNMGCRVNILNEATKEGNKSIDELKRGTALQTLQNVRRATKKGKGELDNLQQQKNVLESEIEALKDTKSTQGNELNRLLKQKNALDREIKALKNMKNIQGQVLSSQQIKNIKTESIMLDNEKVKISKSDLASLQKSALLGEQAEKIYESSKAYLQKAESVLKQAEQKQKEPTKEKMERLGLKKKMESYNKALNQCPEEVLKVFNRALKLVEEKNETKMQDIVR